MCFAFIGSIENALEEKCQFQLWNLAPSGENMDVLCKVSQMCYNIQKY